MDEYEDDMISMIIEFPSIIKMAAKMTFVPLVDL